MDGLGAIAQDANPPIARAWGVRRTFGSLRADRTVIVRVGLIANEGDSYSNPTPVVNVFAPHSIGTASGSSSQSSVFTTTIGLL